MHQIKRDENDNSIDQFYSDKFSEFIRLLLIGDRLLLCSELEKKRESFWCFLNEHQEEYAFKHIEIPVRKNTVLYKITGRIALKIAYECYELIKTRIHLTETIMETFVEAVFNNEKINMDFDQYYLINK